MLIVECWITTFSTIQTVYTVENMNFLKKVFGQIRHNPLSGGYCGEVPPLPIPNREVKLTCADGTAWKQKSLRNLSKSEALDKRRRLSTLPHCIAVPSAQVSITNCPNTFFRKFIISTVCTVWMVLKVVIQHSTININKKHKILVSLFLSFAKIQKKIELCK